MGPEIKDVYVAEPCREPGCEALVKRRDGSRCGGVLFGTKDQMPHSCGGFFCDRHLWGRAGPFRCLSCHNAMKEAEQRGH